MTKPVAYLRDRPLAQHALVMAYKRALEKQEARASTERERPLKVDRQLNLPLGEWFTVADVARIFNVPVSSLEGAVDQEQEK